MRTMSTSDTFFLLSSMTRIEGYTNLGCERIQPVKINIFLGSNTDIEGGIRTVKLSQPPSKSPQ